jgi:hypothetical protein
MAVAKIKLRKIAVQVLLFAVLIYAAHALLEHAEIALGTVGSHVAAGIFLCAVVHGFVAGHAATDVFVPRSLIGH